jgi:hypothetical protein
VVGPRAYRGRQRCAATGRSHQTVGKAPMKTTNGCCMVDKDLPNGGSKGPHRQACAAGR